MKDGFIFLSLILLFTVTITISTSPEISGQVSNLILLSPSDKPEIHGVKFKVVIDFESNNDFELMKDRIAIKTQGQLNGIVTSMSAKYNLKDVTFVTLSDNELLRSMGYNSTSGKEMYQLYPKLIIKTTTPFEDNFTNKEYNIVLGKIRQMMMVNLNSEDASSVISSIHYSWGKVYFEEN